MMINILDVNTGEIKLGFKNDILTCRALGSCVAVVIMDAIANMGGIAHIMLPNKAPKHSRFPNRYAENAINNLLDALKKNGSSGKYLACIAGAGNVLKRKEDTICSSNISSVLKSLKSHQIQIAGNSTGGYERRSIKYNTGKQCVNYTIGNSIEMLLYDLSK